MKRDDRELLSAYADGVAELDGDERRRVEELLARDGDARADLDATRALLDRLHALPQTADPDFAALERSIARAVGDGVPRPWWRQWRWLVPIGALAATAAAALLWLRAPAHENVATPTRPIDAGIAKDLVEQSAAVVESLWIGGQFLDIDDPAAAETQLDALDRDARDALALDTDDVTGGILPATDTAWIDNLDDAALDRAERFLERKKT
jgi:hypothetical protein